MSDVLQLLADVEKAAIGQVKLKGALEAARGRVADAQKELDEIEASAGSIEADLVTKYDEIEAAGLPREKAMKLVDDKLQALVSLGLLDAIEISDDKDAKKPAGKKRASRKEGDTPPASPVGGDQTPPAVVPPIEPVIEPPVVVEPVGTAPASVEPAAPVPPVAVSTEAVVEPAAEVQPALAQAAEPVVEPQDPEEAPVEEEPEADAVFGDDDGSNGEESGIPAHFNEEDESPAVVWDGDGEDGDQIQLEEEQEETETAPIAAAAARPGVDRAARPAPVAAETVEPIQEAPDLENSLDPTLGPAPALTPDDDGLPDFLRG